MLNLKRVFPKTSAFLGLTKGIFTICLHLSYKKQSEVGFPEPSLIFLMFIKSPWREKDTHIQVQPMAAKFKEIYLDILSSNLSLQVTPMYTLSDKRNTLLPEIHSS